MRRNCGSNQTGYSDIHCRRLHKSVLFAGAVPTTASSYWLSRTWLYLRELLRHRHLVCSCLTEISRRRKKMLQFEWPLPSGTSRSEVNAAPHVQPCIRYHNPCLQAGESEGRQLPSTTPHKCTRQRLKSQIPNGWNLTPYKNTEIASPTVSARLWWVAH